MAIPSFRAAGTQVASANSVAASTNLTPTKNAGTVNGDLMVLVTNSRSRTASCTVANWNVVSGFPKRSGTASGGTIYAFTRIADGTAGDAPTVAWTGLTTGTSGDSTTARILSYQNATETADGTPPAANDAASTTSITIPAHVTSVAQSLVIGIAMRVNDTAHTFTTATFTERFDGHTTSGTGHGTTVSEKINATAGSSGTATVTPSNTTSSRTLAASFAVRAKSTTVAIGQVTETGTAQAVTERKTRSVGQTSTTETAQPVTVTLVASGITVSVGQATETSTAQPVARIKTRSTGQVSETGTAQALTLRKTRAIALATETGAAQPVSLRKTRSIALVTQTDTAQAVSVRKYRAIGMALETNTAQSVTFLGAATTGAGAWVVQMRRRHRR